METRVLTSAIKTSKEILMKLTWVTNDPSSIRRIVNNKAAGATSSAGKESTCNSWVGKIRWRMDRLPTSVFLGFPGGSDGKESACNVGDLGSIPGLGRSPGEGNSYPPYYFALENSMDREVWYATVHGAAKSQTWLSNFHCQWKQGAVSQNLPPYDDADWTLSQILNGYAKHERTNFTVLRHPDVFIIKFSTTATLL